MMMLIKMMIMLTIRKMIIIDNDDDDNADDDDVDGDEGEEVNSPEIIKSTSIQQLLKVRNSGLYNLASD